MATDMIIAKTDRAIAHLAKRFADLASAADTQAASTPDRVTSRSLASINAVCARASASHFASQSAATCRVMAFHPPLFTHASTTSRPRRSNCFGPISVAMSIYRLNKHSPQLLDLLTSKSLPTPNAFGASVYFEQRSISSATIVLIGSRLIAACQTSWASTPK